MTKFKKIGVLSLAVLTVLATSITAFAFTNAKTPAEIAAGLVGKSVEEVIAERDETGKTYGTLAAEEGKLEEFKTEMLEAKKAILQQKVADGSMTQEEADEIIALIEENQLNCDGTGNEGVGCNMRAGFGKMMGNGQGRGLGLGRQQNGNGSCSGLGFGEGSCDIN